MHTGSHYSVRYFINMEALKAGSPLLQPLAGVVSWWAPTVLRLTKRAAGKA
jgi:hypothetical protein